MLTRLGIASQELSTALTADDLNMTPLSRIWLASLFLLLGGCASVADSNTAASEVPTTLAPCPSSPNCVSSASSNPGQAIEPFSIADDRVASWARLQALLEASSEFTIIKATETYLHAEARTRLFRFVDDVEFLLEAEDIAVRSASRIGFSDFGTNRRRIENLRRQLAAEPVAAAN